MERPLAGFEFVRVGLVQGEQAGLVAPDSPGGIQDTCDLLTAVDRGETTIDAWLERAETDRRVTRLPWTALVNGDALGWRLTIPLTPPEVWGCGVTYRRSADFRAADLGTAGR